MNQKTRTIGLFTILSLAMVAIAPSLIDDAEANSSSRPEAQTPPLNYQQLQEQALKQVLEPVSLVLVQMEFTDANTSVKEKYTKSTAPIGRDGIESFTVAYYVINEGDGDVKNVEVLFKSDIETVQTKITGNADTRNTVSTSIKAIDPNSIDATIVSFEVIN